ncbi:DUF6087 family protein [Streptomyces sp. NPDC005574]|uniref:DUF6087 family protein n=1 Tax=Streptomyces sp. NPDC005574 TaxID=3156891 RepID=UPI0033A75DA4
MATALDCFKCRPGAAGLSRLSKRRAVPLGNGPQRGTYLAPAGHQQWDKHRWTPTGVADDRARAAG